MLGFNHVPPSNDNPRWALGIDPLESQLALRIRYVLAQPYRVMSAYGKEVLSDGSYRNIILGPTYTLDKRSEAVVFMESTNSKGDVGGSTAVYLGNGQYLTCAHCVDGMTDCCIVEFAQGQDIKHPISIVKSDSDRDLALIKSTYTVQTSLAVSPSDANTLDPVLVLHYPRVSQRLRTLVATTGEINAVVRDYYSRQYLMISARTAPGSSGGAVLDDRGRLVGIVVELAFDATSTDMSPGSGNGGTIWEPFYHAVPPADIRAFL